MKQIVIFNPDGIYRELAARIFPEAECVKWTPTDLPLAFPEEGTIYLLDLPSRQVFGRKLTRPEKQRVVSKFRTFGQPSTLAPGPQ